ncbi:unnamed protein product, partial [Mesorhabditis spiculigera]
MAAMPNAPATFKQKLAVAHYVFLWLVCPIMSLWVPLYLLTTNIWPLVLAYFGWMFLDYSTPRKGGRSWKWYQRLSLWKHFRDYFPLRMVKTADLPADRNYILGSHPHGVLSFGIFGNCLTAASGFREQFPGIQPSVATLDGQFKFAVRRDFAMGMGGVSAAQESISWLLQNPGKGRAVAVVVGGAEEALEARPGATRLRLVKRYGFTKIKSVFGFAPPQLRGTGLFTSFGLLPKRRPVTSVFGSPIECKVDGHEYGTTPDLADVERVHAAYCEQLNELFETHKLGHGYPEEAKLEFF